VTRGALYALLVGVVVLVALAADPVAIKENFFDGAGWGSGGNWGDLITIGARNTVVYTVVAFVGGLLLAFVLALMKLSPVAPYRWLATAYIELFRGLPALLVILFVGLGIPIAFQWTPPGGLVGAGLLALVLVSSAYMAETLRAGIQAVPTGQVEASRSLGMSSGRTMVSVTLPQALRIVVPPLTNEFVLLIKDTALLSVIGVQIGQREITTVARDFFSSGPTSGTATSLVQAALLYLAITVPLTQLVAWLERRQRRSR
jgi:polar amino acid transport system permease protein